MTQSIFHFPTLRARTEAASKLPKGDLPEAGTVVWQQQALIVIFRDSRSFDFLNIDGGWGTTNSEWRYATPAEIDQFERDSALPDIVDPVEAQIDEVLNKISDVVYSPRLIAMTAILNERERARKAGA